MSGPIKDIGATLAHAVKIRSRPVCVYGSDRIPENSVSAGSISPCVASAMYGIAKGTEKVLLYAGNEPGEFFCRCMGGPAWFGYGAFDPRLPGLMSTGSKDMKNCAPKHLKINEKVAYETYLSAGNIKALGKYTVMGACENVRGDPGVRCIVCFGTGEQIRDLCALAHFGSSDLFNTISVPWGPTCATLVTYPAGMSENAPGGRVYVGPIDPSARSWLPDGHMAVGIPVKIAKQMAKDVKNSFLSKNARS